MSRVDELRALLTAATPGPRVGESLVDNPGEWGIFAAAREENTCTAIVFGGSEGRLLTASVNALPALLAIVEAAQELAAQPCRCDLWRPYGVHSPQGCAWEDAIDLRAALAALEAGHAEQDGTR